MPCFSFCDWLVSLSIVPSSFILVVENDRISFFCKSERYFIVYVYGYFIHSSINGYFHNLAIGTSTSLSTGMLLYLRDADFNSFG